MRSKLVYEISLSLICDVYICKLIHRGWSDFGKDKKIPCKYEDRFIPAKLHYTNLEILMLFMELCCLKQPFNTINTIHHNFTYVMDEFM